MNNKLVKFIIDNKNIILLLKRIIVIAMNIWEISQNYSLMNMVGKLGQLKDEMYMTKLAVLALIVIKGFFLGDNISIIDGIMIELFIRELAEMIALDLERQEIKKGYILFYGRVNSFARRVVFGSFN